MKTNENKQLKKPAVKYNPALDKQADTVFFPKKSEDANLILCSTGLSGRKK